MPGILMLFGVAFIYLASTRKFSALIGLVNNTQGTPTVPPTSPPVTMPGGGGSGGGAGGFG